MEKDRVMTINFMDGSKVSFDFPEQKTNEAARAIMLEEILKSPYIMLEAEGLFLMYPVVNIKSIQVMIPPGQARAPAPKGTIRGATVVE
ncbi:MAG TPA: hypothetical protein VLC55_03400 [Burkholderiales bacterium]|nr:hypothetical protein [Burkholderiales bacterium]